MEILHRPFNIATKPNSWCCIYFCFGCGENQSHLCSYSVSVLLSDVTKLTSRRDTVISRALTAIPPSPRRCRVLRPAFSTRNNCRTGTLWVTCASQCTQTHTKMKKTHGGVTHRNNGEDGVDDAGSDGGVDRLLHTGWGKDPSGVIKHLSEVERMEVRIWGL